jgi:hypothetical protein
MSINSALQDEMAHRRRRIQKLLEKMPAEELRFVEQFVQFIDQEGYSVIKESTEHYPTVSLPANTFSQLIGLMPPIGGDALQDSEALYDGTY